MTAHNSPFGWIHSVMFSENNIFVTSNHAKQPLYMPIIPDPRFRQIVRNWNVADTCCAIFTSTAFILFGQSATNAIKEFSILERRRRFMIMCNISILVGLFLGYRNSSYRLEGLVPNGLPARKILEPVKYNYTSQFLDNSIWSLLFSPQRRPTQ